MDSTQLVAKLLLEPIATSHSIIPALIIGGLLALAYGMIVLDSKNQRAKQSLALGATSILLSLILANGYRYYALTDDLMAKLPACEQEFFTLAQRTPKPPQNLLSSRYLSNAKQYCEQIKLKSETTTTTQRN